ncbi:hypothetical protein RJ639_003857 [Escallonia herrerae]|uniref:UBX domain-containing protein n=1 Tax=Escallonia herrerae TaxID=1293975 RepID=A0AA88W1Y6_9ASTE|nr:hypothetical protein RJ639_003857 [Escallonia herrerae]
MEGPAIVPATEQQGLVSSFLEIAVGQTPDTARQFLQATSWKLEEAIQLFYVGNDGGTAAPSSVPSVENDQSLGGLGDDTAMQDDGSMIRPPLPVKREVLYDHALLYGASRMSYSTPEARSVVPFRNFDEELKHPGVWETDQGATSTTDSARDLASLYRPPFALMYHGPFEKAKDAAKAQERWLLVNMQSTREFSSHMLNRDTWANEAVAQTIGSNFIFWQVYEDTEEGSKVCTYYKLDSIPVTLVIDPVTGQKMRLWRGMIQPESLLEDLLPFMDGSPKDHHASLSHKRPRESSHAPPPSVGERVAADGSNEEEEDMRLALEASTEGIKDASGMIAKDINVSNTEREELCKPEIPAYPPLPEEPQGDRNLLCSVRVRLPDGRRIQRKFFRTDPIQLLWSFCHAQLEEGGVQPFRLSHAIPGASKCLEYDRKLSFEESGLSNSMISVSWE